MEITEVRIKLMADPHERLLAFCSVTFDQCFVIRDLKIIQGTKGAFVAMPSRKLTDRCPQCNMKNHLRSTFCNQCGANAKEDQCKPDRCTHFEILREETNPGIPVGHLDLTQAESKQASNKPSKCEGQG